jgi:hypothetical protein
LEEITDAHFADPNLDRENLGDLEEDSPYPEVRSAVANTDDPDMPCNTIRVWILGMIMAVIIPGLNQFLCVVSFPSDFCSGGSLIGWTFLLSASSGIHPLPSATLSDSSSHSHWVAVSQRSYLTSRSLVPSFPQVLSLSRNMFSSPLWPLSVIHLRTLRTLSLCSACSTISSGASPVSVSLTHPLMAPSLSWAAYRASIFVFISLEPSFVSND